METFTHAEGNLDDEVYEKSKSGSDTDVESGLEKIEALGRLWFKCLLLAGLAYAHSIIRLLYYPIVVFFFFFWRGNHKNKSMN